MTAGQPIGGGSISSRPAVVLGGIYDKWITFRGLLGEPVADEEDLGYGVVRQRFVGGEIYAIYGRGIFAIWGPMRDYWDGKLRQNGDFLWPNSDPVNVGLGWIQGFEGGVIAWHPSFGAHGVRGAIVLKWFSVRGNVDYLGYPATEEGDAAYGGRWQTFEGGQIHWHPDVGAYASRNGPVHDRWATYEPGGWERSWLGYPTSDQGPAGWYGEGLYQKYQGGYIHWSPQTGAVVTLNGPTLDKWNLMGWERSWLGFPRASGLAAYGGLWQTFEHGQIHWHPDVGAWPTHDGPIHDLWANYPPGGWERSWLGYPVGDEGPAGWQNEGKYQKFQGGYIHWSPATGAVVSLNGPLVDRWRDLKWERGFLGFPYEQGLTSDGGSFEHFERGWLYHHPRTGAPATAIYGAIFYKWAAMGAERGWLDGSPGLGYPVTDERPTSDSGGRFNKFEHGYIHWTPLTGAHETHIQPIVAKWDQMGFEQSYLGYPTSDTLATPDGAFWQDFQGGTISWYWGQGEATANPRRGNLGWNPYSSYWGGVSPLGNFVRTEVDISIPTIGPSLQLARTYNSLEDRFGPFGKGWTFNYDIKVERDWAGNAAVRYPDGRYEFHTFKNGNFVPPTGFFSTLTGDGYGGYQLRQPDGTLFSFNSQGQLTEILDRNVPYHPTLRNDRRLGFSYDPSGHLITVTAASGRSISITWQDNRIIRATTDTFVWRYEYTAGGNLLVRACDARNNPYVAPTNCTGYGYTGQGSLEHVERPSGAGGELGIAYTPFGRVALISDARASTSTFNYQPDSVRVTDPRAHVWVREFDGFMRLTKEIDPYGNAITHGYDARGNRNTTRDPNGAQTTVDHDGLGNATRIIDPEGHVWLSSFDGASDLLSSVDARFSSVFDASQYATEYSYDPYHNKWREQSPATADFGRVEKKWTYTTGDEPWSSCSGTAPYGRTGIPYGLVRTATDENGLVTTFTYNCFGDLEVVKGPGGRITTYAYDASGRKTVEQAFSAPGSPATFFAYNAIGQLTGILEPPVRNNVTGLVHKKHTSLDYDWDRRLVRRSQSDVVGSEKSRTWNYTYLPTGQVETVTDPENGTVSYSYDPNGNQILFKDQLLRWTVTQYDDRNLPVWVYSPRIGEGGTNLTLASYEYDRAGRKIKQIDGRGRVVRFDYDNNGRLRQATLVGYHNLDGSTRDLILEKHSYDESGHVIQDQINGGATLVTYGYDNAGRLTLSTYDRGGVGRSTAFHYDRGGRVTRRTTTDDAGGYEQRWAYDDVFRVVRSTVENGDVDLTTVAEYDTRGLMTAQTDPEGRTTAFGYDELGRPVQTKSASVALEGIGTSPTEGNPTIEIGYDTYSNPTHNRDERGSTTTYSYDLLDRRRSISYPPITQDGTTLGATESFDFDPVGNLKASTDRRGNITRYEHDPLNRIQSQTDPASGLTTFSYDEVGNVKATQDPRGAVRRFNYDDLNRVREDIVDVRGDPGSPYVTTHDYDDLSNETYTRNPANEVTRRSFSTASELKVMTDPTGASWTTSYDVMSRPKEELDPLGHRTTHTYDLAGREVATDILNPSGGLEQHTSATYDRVGNLTTATSGRGFTKTYEYDSLDRLLAVTQPISDTAASSPGPPSAPTNVTVVTSTVSGTGSVPPAPTTVTTVTSTVPAPPGPPPTITTSISGTGPRGYRDEVLADNPAGYWRLGESSGAEAADSSGRGRTGTYIGGVTLNTPSPVAGGDGAASFDGSTAQVRIPLPFTQATNVTLESWVNLPDTRRKGAFVKIGGDPDGYALGVGAAGNFDNPGNRLIGLYEGIRWIDSGVDIGTGWHHVALVIDASGTASFFLDGTQVATSTGLVPLAPSTGGTVGGYVAFTTYVRYFNGGVDEAAVYPQALSPARIAAHYRAGTTRTLIYKQTVNQSSPSGYWRLGDVSGTATAADASGNGATATYLNGVQLGQAGALPGDPDTSVHLSGGGQRVAAGDRFDFPGTAPFTLEIWVNPDSTPQEWLRLISKEDYFTTYSRQGYVLYHEQNSGRVTFGRVRDDAADEVWSPNPLPLGVWTHVAASYDGSVMRIFINGSEVASGPSTRSIIDHAQPFTLGAPSSEGHSYFKGKLDDAAVYSRVLIPQEIAAHYVARNPQPPPPPYANFSSPGAGSTVTGTAPIAATVTGGPAAGVQFKADGANLGPEDTTIPYGTSWNTTALANGFHTISAVARNLSGTITTTTTITVGVNNGAPADRTPPAVAFAKPIPGATVTGTVAVSALVSDSVGVAGVQFKVDTTDVGAEDTLAPYTATWNTAGVANGLHTVTAVARDTAGNITTVTITTAVNNSTSTADRTPPTAAISSPRAGATVSGTISVSASASDGVGVAGVQFLIDGIRLGSEDTTDPYSAVWNTTGLANGLHTVSAAGRDGPGNMITVTITTAVNNSAVIPFPAPSPPVQATSNIARSSFGYDAAGNRVRTTDARGNSTWAGYNAWNLPDKVVEPGTTPEAQRTFSTSYDSGGLPTTNRLPGGVVVQRGYDSLGRLRTESASGGGAAAAARSFGYDPGGLLTSIDQPSGQTFSYDDRGLLRQSAGPQGATSYGYDRAGRMTSRVDPVGAHAFTWTPRGELQSATDPLTGVTRTYTWNAGSQLERVTYGTGGAVRTYGYDGWGRLTSDSLKNTSGSETARSDYAYDADSNLTSQRINLPSNPASGVYAYAYDGSNRLLAAQDPTGQTTAYGWDKTGNRTRVGAVNYSYDAQNRLVADSANTYTYSPRGTLERITGPAGTTTMAYDAFDRLTNYNGQATYTYDSLDRVKTRNGAAFTYAGLDIDPATDPTTRYARSPSGRLLAVKDAGPARIAGLTPHQDVSHLFSASGAVSDTTVYGPFGQPLGRTGPTTNGAGYQGDYTDPASGQVWMGARWYLPSTGTFSARDTIAGVPDNPLSQNRYTYAQANPLRRFDPDGHYVTSEADCDPARPYANGCEYITSDPMAGFTDDDISEIANIVTSGVDILDVHEVGSEAVASWTDLRQQVAYEEWKKERLAQIEWIGAETGFGPEAYRMSYLRAQTDYITTFQEMYSLLGPGPQFGYNPDGSPNYNRFDQSREVDTYCSNPAHGGTWTCGGGPGLSLSQVFHFGVAMLAVSAAVALCPETWGFTCVALGAGALNMVGQAAVSAAYHEPVTLGSLGMDFATGAGSVVLGAAAEAVIARAAASTVVRGVATEGAGGGGTTTAYRVEGPGNARLNIGPEGNVAVKGDSTLFVNFGDEARAQSFLDRRLAQGYDGTQIKSFEVPNSYVDHLRASSVPENMARRFPDRPFSVDVNQAADQFGLRACHLPGLLAAIIPGSGRNGC